MLQSWRSIGLVLLAPSGENFPDPLDLRHPIVRTNAKLLRRAYLTRVVLALDGA